MLPAYSDDTRYPRDTQTMQTRQDIQTALQQLNEDNLIGFPKPVLPVNFAVFATIDPMVHQATRAGWDPIE